jgi:syntaxin 5
MVVQRDRSQELYQLFEGVRAARQLHSSDSGSGTPASEGNRSAVGSNALTAGRNDLQVFNDFAQAFAKEISQVSETVMRLTKLMQQQTLFDEKGKEIGSLTTIVKSSLGRLHDDMETLALLKDRAAASRSNQSSGWMSRDEGSSAAAVRHNDTVVDTLRSRLVKTGQQFKTVLQERTKSLKETASRRNQFSSDRPTSFESALFREQDSGSGQQEMQMTMHNSASQYYKQRYEAVREVEAAVMEVGELFQDFTRLVHEQDEVLVRIDNDVEDSLRNVNAGSNELLRYLSNLSSNRGLVIKILGVLFCFLLFFGFVVVR